MHNQEWIPKMVLGHEFSLLPFLYPHGYPDHRQMHHLGEEEDATQLLLTLGCPSMQDVQNRLFRLGFGPLPYFRRPGVLLNISELASDHENEGMRRLGVVVSHRPGVHGCSYGDENMQMHADERCYFCHDNPFYEVLFSGPRSRTIIRVQPQRAVERAVATGEKLLLRAGAMERIVPGFRYQVLSSRCPGDRIGLQFVLKNLPPQEGWTTTRHYTQ